jgi:hypothetical protein
MNADLTIAHMEVLLGYVLGLGTVLALAKRGESRGGDKRGEGGLTQRGVAWTARQVGSMSAKVKSSLGDATRVMRDEYARGREEQLAKHGGSTETVVHRASVGHLNGN